MSYNGNIYEYDIKAAAFNIMRIEIIPKNIVPPDKIKEILTFSKVKLKRNILLGLMQRNYPETKEIFTQSYKNTLNQFKILNNIEDKDVISSTKDSILVKKECDILQVGDYTFALKNTFSNYITFKINGNRKQDVYFDSINNKIEIKGSTRYLNENKGIITFAFTSLFNLYNIIKDKKEFFIAVKKFRNMLEKNYNDFVNKNDIVTINISTTNALKIKSKFSNNFIIDKNKILVDYFDSFANKLIRNKG